MQEVPDSPQDNPQDNPSDSLRGSLWGSLGDSPWEALEVPEVAADNFEADFDVIKRKTKNFFVDKIFKFC